MKSNSLVFLLRKSLQIIFIIAFVNTSYAQIWKQIEKGAKDIQKSAREVRNTAREVKSTSTEIKNTAKLIKKTWTKDTSANIRYRQIPDYRSREEVGINKKLKLSIENGDFVNLTWSPVTKFDNQIFPSFVIGWASYKGIKNEDMGSSLGFNISTQIPKVILKWEIESSDKEFFSIDSGYINCDELKNRMFMPKIAWNYKALIKHENSAPLNIYFRLTDPNTGKKIEKLATINLRSVNDCIIAYNSTKFHYMFASYVNEDHPDIDKILKQMLNTKMIDAVWGYQGGDPFTDLQVAALWRVLHEKGFQYSSITDNTGYNENKGLFTQTVRTFDNSLKTSQANCVDGTVLFASILKRIGLRTVLVTVPGHCFLGYYANDNSDQIRYLETTIMSDKVFLEDPKSSVKKYADILAKYLPKDSKMSTINKAYYLEFLQARIAGENAYKEKMEKYGPNAINKIDVNEMRKYIKPIPLL
ncbi:MULTISPECIES: hypothetical protein [unclassified Spirosoma]|uniref:hypothetical protein n=1 Tax=unclassified Spirosoma TaxID=2621999 RepID=UPI000959015B|nr:MULTISPECIES: hypothetical protein [unclassified Spirosoma]MBN8826568.1 hypothetical protein [Spirosoma sp.]OJW72859.1 MAG: hypothetical protein BGO59_08690 [Spirosoma sp. 48-14]